MDTTTPSMPPLSGGPGSPRHPPHAFSPPPAQRLMGPTTNQQQQAAASPAPTPPPSPAPPASAPTRSPQQPQPGSPCGPGGAPQPPPPPPPPTPPPSSSSSSSSGRSTAAAAAATMSAGAGPVPSACVTQSSFVQWMRDNNLASAAVMSTLCNPADADAAQADADGGPACDYVSASSMAVQMEAMRKKELHDAQKEIRDAAMSIFAQEVTLRPGIKTGRQGDAAAAAATTTTTTTTLTTNNSSIGKNEQITNPVEGTPQPPAVEMVEDVIPINTNMQPFQSPPQPEGYAVNNYPQATSPNPQVQHKTPKQRGRHPGSTNKQTSPPNAIASLGLTTGQYSKLHRILMTLMEPSLNDYSLQFGELTPPEREALLLMMHNLALNLGHLRLAQTTTTLARTMAPLYHPPPPQQPPSPMTVTLLPSGADRPTSHSIIRRQQIKPYTEPLGVTVPLVPLQLEPITSNLEPQTM